MGAGKLRVLAGRGVVAVGVATLLAGCGQASPAASLAPWQTPPPATPTMTPSAVPVLGQLAFGTFRATGDGANALSLCEDWAGLRGQYVARVGTGTPYQLEQWFSSAVWRPAFNVSSSLRLDPHYGEVSVAFGLATTGAAASVGSAKLLDKACAAAD
jgi:hypothetical protein